MKHLGMILLVGGIAVSASYGARLSPEMRNEMAVKGKAKLSAAAAKSAFDAWCKQAGVQHPLAKADGCGSVAKAADTLIEDAGLSAALKGARQDWVQASLQARADTGAAAALPQIKPKARLISWFGESGVPFTVGLVLVVLGSVIARRRAGSDLDGQDQSAEAVDFGHVMGQLHEELERLAASLAQDVMSNEEAKLAVENAQMERFAPLIEARGRLQARYGLAGYAEVFGPLSGSERRVNRAWSALVDDHRSEATTSISEALQSLGDAQSALNRLVQA
ncbi:MAG TPA: hypothetical protein DCQ06_13900 [Myxococcales bacterium]|nr:hypothetical protein [Myxococcales bacterium]